MFVFVLFFVLVVAIALIPINYYSFYFGVEAVDFDTSSAYFYLAMVIGGLTPFLIPFKKQEGDYSDCKNNGRDPVVGHGGGDRARSEYSSSQTFSGEKWHSVSIFIPNDFKSVEPVSTSFFQFYERGEGPRMMLRPKYGVLDPRYYPINGMDSGGVVHKPLEIDDMRGKWTTIIFHTKTSKDPTKGFMKMYVNDALYNEYEGRTSLGKGKHYSKFGIYHSWISRWVDKVHGKYPTQVIYYDNLFRANKKEKLLKLIQQ